MAQQTYDADVRYGSSFLSISNHDKSVSGEIMTDKMTGEVYIKRPHDNKIISFRQKSHSVYEAIQEFNIQFQSSIGFTYPEDPGSYLLGTKVSVNEFSNDEDKVDILMDNHEFSQTRWDETNFRLELSPKTNGFYIKPITRLGDRNAIGYLTGQFSEHEYLNFSSLKRTFTEWLDLSTHYSSPYLYTEWGKMERWSSSNALVDCTISTTGTTETGDVIENVKIITVPIQLDEYNFISFPDDYDEEMNSIYSLVVQINKIYAPKLQYERYLANDSNTSSGINSIVDRMLDVDDKVVLQSIDTFYFISSSSQLPTTENIIINHCYDVEFLEQSIVNLSTASGSRAIQSQAEEPQTWPVDTLWAEEIRNIEYGGKITETSSKNKFIDLERALYQDPSNNVEYTDQLTNAENVLVTNISI